MSPFLISPKKNSTVSPTGIFKNIRSVWSDEETVSFLKLIRHLFYIVFQSLKFNWHCFNDIISVNFCIGLMVPSWRISTTSCLSQSAQLPIFTQYWWMETRSFAFPFAVFVEIQFKFALHLDGCLYPVALVFSWSGLS